MIDRDALLIQANSFGSAAREYERGRPPYPVEAIDWLLAETGPRVLDLGAGTGQLTRQLVSRGLDVVAVEPSRCMREGLVQAVPDAEVLAGAAEDIPLKDGAVDVVLVAQAWHWVDVERAISEVARVLAPGGQLGLMWNIRDERVSWVSRLGRLMHQGTEQDMNSERPHVGRPFAAIERLDVEWTHDVTREALLDLVASRSYIITLTPEEKAAVLDRVRTLLGTHPALAGRNDIQLPYVTRCSRTALTS